MGRAYPFIGTVLVLTGLLWWTLSSREADQVLRKSTLAELAQLTAEAKKIKLERLNKEIESRTQMINADALQAINLRYDIERGKIKEIADLAPIRERSLALEKRVKKKLAASFRNG